MDLRSSLRRAAPLSLILCFALLLRLWYVVTLPGQGGQDLIFSDMANYDQTAWCLVQGLPVTGGPGFNGYHPLSASTYYFVGYTYFLAAIYALFGHDVSAVRLIQAIVGAATVGAVYLVGNLAFGRRPGLVAASLTAVHLPLVYYAGLLLTETWFTFLQVAALALWIRSWAHGQGPEVRPMGPLLAIAAGLTAGLASLTRAAFVLVVGLLAVTGLFLPPVATPYGQRLVRVTFFLLAAATVITPITIRNYQIHGRFILISTNGPSTFLTGHVTHEPTLPPERPGMTDAKMAELHRARSLDYLRRHWGTYLAEIPEFFEIIWTGNDFWPGTFRSWWKTPDSGRARMDVQIFPRGSPPFGRATYFPDLVRHVDRLVWCVIGLPMGLLAALLLPAQHRRWVPLYFALVPYVVIPFIASAFPRYRIPMVPLIFILAGQALVVCWESRRARAADLARAVGERVDVPTQVVG
jgi:4-amino-4-deoxy-L-arabinose transferase-like glycosyltransferase